jgi:antitoxin YefM
MLKLQLCTQYGTLMMEVKKMVNFISIRELRPELSKILQKIHRKFDRYIVTRRGKPEAIILSIEDYESMLETLEIQSDKKLMKRLKKAEQDLKKGKGISLEKLHQEMKIV